MSIELREFVEAIVSVSDKEKSNQVELKESLNYSNKIAEDSIFVDIEALHSVLLGNCRVYSNDSMINSEKLWTDPYEIPVIYNHDEKNGKIIGRVKNAKHIERSSRSDTGALLLTANIADKEAIKGILNGTLATVSIGATGHDVRCSICGTNLAEKECSHEKGEYYGDKLCYWIINDFTPKEVSFVIVPSDKYAHVVDVYKPSTINTEINNLQENKEVNEMEKALDDKILETEQIGLTESKEVEKEIEKKVEQEEVKKDVENTQDKQEDNKEEEIKKEEENKKTEIVIEDTDIYKNMKIAIDSLKSENEMLKSELEKIKSELRTEIELKESAENQLLELKTEQKQRLVKKVNNLRESLNLEKEDEELLMKSSKSSLETTVQNLKEFSSHVGALAINKVKSEIAISESKDNTQKNITNEDVKEVAKSSNINLEESLLIENILSAALCGSRN